MILTSFIVFLALVLAIGVSSMLRSRRTTSDYYLCSRSVHPSLVGLSAVATNNSGYMFIGVIGFTYATGLPAIWLMVGWIIGDLLASLAVHRELRVATEKTGQLTFAGVIGRWGGREFFWVRVLAALLTIVFLGAYAAAQFSAGGKALQSLFGWDLRSGALMVAVVVAAYCLAGGLRASIWTDAAQSFIMLVSMGLLLVTAVQGLGGVEAAYARLNAIPQFMDWFPDDLPIPGISGMALFVIGWLFAGVSVIGQPHIMVRFMALDEPDRLTHARIWYYGFFTVFYGMATAVGLLSRLYLPELANLDAELALPQMARILLPPVLVGLILAGIFAATMSTADSLVLSCSASLTHDLAPQTRSSLWISKLATLGVTALAFFIAIAGPTSVFTLVILAWSTLASAFGPLVIVYARGRRPSQALVLAMMIVGPVVALLWRWLGLHGHIYEGMPGMLAGLLVYAVGSRLALQRTSADAALMPLTEHRPDSAVER